MQLLYCDKYADQGMVGVIHSKSKAGLPPAHSRGEVGWGGRVANPPSPSGQKQKLPSAFSFLCKPSHSTAPFSSQIQLPAPLFHALNNRGIRTPRFQVCKRKLSVAQRIAWWNVLGNLGIGLSTVAQSRKLSG